MADSDIISRIKYLIKELNFRQTEFAKKLALTLPTCQSI